MAVLDNELLEDAALDAEIVAHVRRSLPSEVSARFDEEQLYYFHDLIEEFLADSDILDAEPDKEGFVNVEEDDFGDFHALFHVGPGMMPRWTRAL